MDLRNDPEQFDERLDEFADTPPPTSRTGGAIFRRASSTTPAMPCNAPTRSWTR